MWILFSFCHYTHDSVYYSSICSMFYNRIWKGIPFVSATVALVGT